MSGRFGGGRRGRGDGSRGSGFRGNRDHNRDRDRGRRRGYDGRHRDGEDYGPDSNERTRGSYNRRDRVDSNISEGNDNRDQESRPIVLAKSDRAMEREKMEKEFPALGKPDVKKSPSEGVEEQASSGAVVPGPGVIMVKQRNTTSAARSDSPAVSSQAPSKPVLKKEEKITLKQKNPVKLLDESHSFCDGILDYLTDNQDFLVVGVLGLQNTGKSTILNILAKNSVEDDEIFRIQTFEHQMLAEHCTNGIDVYVNSRRHIFLDCQPLLSASVLDRCVQLEKKTTPEFSSAEKTIEVQSLQLIGFMFSVCHVVVLVKDWFLDFGLIRLMQAAETLKPVTPTTSGNNNQVIEYFPSLVMVHNKCEVADFEDDTLDEIKECYSQVWGKSRLHWKEEDSGTAAGSPHVVLLPDHEGERADSLSIRIRPRIDLEKAGRMLRYKVLNMPRRPLTQTRLSERGWVSLASKTWDNIKNSAFYMEYSRLLP